MYRSWSDLSFTTAYIGVVQADDHAPAGHYAKLRRQKPPGIGVWYFEHSDGTLWIATGGQHAEPVTTWLHDAHVVFHCTTMLAAVLSNGVKAPPPDGYLFRIRRNELSAVHELLLRDCFTVYLPHCDEFLIFASFRRYWAIADVSAVLPARTTINKRLSFEPPGPRPPRPGDYDPIEAQIREVLGSVSETARRAAADLLSNWKEILGPPVPADIENLQRKIGEQIDLVSELRRRAQDTGDDVSSQIDECAHALQSMRRTAFDLRTRIRDYEWPPRDHSTYESIATPLMLRALQRYAADLASQFGITSYLLPLVGEDFAAASLRLPKLAAGQRTEVIEIPPEIRLRLGALPMIAHPIAHLMKEHVDNITGAIAKISANEHSWISELRLDDVGLLGKDARGDYALLRERIRQAEREVAADLLAAALSGPPYVFAMAMFAIGNLGESASAASRPKERPPFRLRLALCLALLESLGHATRFSSRYYTRPKVDLPENVVKAVKDVTSGVRPVDEAKIADITYKLARGRIADGRPTEILTALWRAVAGRTGYLNEVAALISIATSAAGEP